ncbi:hypothetical protein KKH18_07000 [bacterium]|nr:hypothetical protein [bacterium]
MSRHFDALANEVRGLIKDGDGYVSEDELAAAVRRGIARLAEARPRRIIADFPGNSSAQVFTLPNSFEPCFSDVVKVLYPFDASAVELPEDLELARLTLVETGDGTYKLRLPFAPANAKQLRVVFTAHHTVNEQTSTIKAAADEDAVIHWAAAECLRIMAAKAIGVGDSLLGADTVSYQSRSSQYKSLAEFYEEQSGLKTIPGFVFNRVFVTTNEGLLYLTH